MEPTSTPRPLRKSNGRIARRRGHPENQTEVCPATNGESGFLSNRFLPLVESGSWKPIFPKQMEEEFFTSIRNFADLYQMELVDRSVDRFPFNMFTIYRKAKEMLAKVAPAQQLVILEDDQYKGTVATMQTFETGRMLYYIPVSKLASFLSSMADPKYKAALVSAFAYLYQVVRIPYYTQSGTSMSMYYGTIIENALDNEADWEAEDLVAIKNLYATAIKKGKAIRRIIKNPKHLLKFEERLEALKPATKKDAALRESIDQVFCLYKDHPNRSLYDNIHYELLSDREDGTSWIDVDEYISFYWGGDDFFHRDVMEYIDGCLSEKGEAIEPQSIQYFDAPQSSVHHDFSFETRFFTMIENFSDFLFNQLK